MRTMARARCEASEENVKDLQDKRNLRRSVFADQEGSTLNLHQKSSSEKTR